MSLGSLLVSFALLGNSLVLFTLFGKVEFSLLTLLGNSLLLFALLGKLQFSLFVLLSK